jgi:outer membrane receptor protein involved in Fe transport
LALGSSGAVYAAEESQAPRSYAIDAGSLDSALNALSRQAHLHIVYPPQLVGGHRARALSGTMSWRGALDRLLQGTGLTYTTINEKTIVIRRGEPEPPASAPPPASKPSAAAAGAKPSVTDIQGMTVTGSRIRGGTSPSPVITIGAEKIRQEGFSDLGEVIRSVPQNFGGGQNPGVLMGNVAGSGLANQNVTGGSGLNLRGLGPDASVTLLNGRRMAYGGFSQAVDISAIPVDAVERVEIVADGASAIYGSDAVGGVGNVIVKREFDGLTLGWRYGTATDGGLATREIHATGGTTWSSGGVIATAQRVNTDPIDASQRSYTNQLPASSMIYPGSVSNSMLVSAHQAVGDHVELHLDALRTQRDQTFHYSIGDPNSYEELTPTSTSRFVAPSVEVMLPGDWLMALSGAWGKDDLRQRHFIHDIATDTPKPYIDDCYCNQSRTHELSAEGPLFEAGGGDARLAVGAGYRKNSFRWTTQLPASSPNATYGSDSSRFVYAELNVPMISPSANLHAVQRLDLTFAIRREDYRSFGGVSTPKIGVIYSPSSDYTLRASWGRSFKAPTLFQLYRPHMAQLAPVRYFGGVGYPPDATVLISGGGNPSLEPERARTWSASLAFHPESAPGLQAELSFFRIDYTGRVVEPITQWSQALSSPSYAEFVVRSPSRSELDQVMAAASRLYNLTGQPYDPSKVGALVYAQYLNVNRQRIQGADLNGSYRFNLGAGAMTVSGAASWIDSVQRTSSSLPSRALSGMLFNPPRIKGRIGAAWVKDAWSVSGFLNYVGGVTDPSNGHKAGSFTTADATVRYDTGKRSDAWSGLEIALAAQNLLNRKPPLYQPIHPDYVPPYDSTNNSPIGRQLSLSVSKHW